MEKPSEVDVADDIAPREPHAAAPFWESKLFLLILGSLLIPLILSGLQRHYEKVKWIAQSKYDAQHARAVAMREALTDFAIIEGTVLQSRSIAVRYRSANNVAARSALFNEFAATNVTYHQEVGRALGALNIFPDRSELRVRFDQFVGSSEDILRETSEVLAADNSRKSLPPVQFGYRDNQDPFDRLSRETTAFSQQRYASLNALAFQALEEIESSLEK
jgi:hypothetical protein